MSDRPTAAPLSRRALLRGGLTLGCSAAAFPLSTRVTFASAPGDNRLVVIVLRGALDGLAAVGPWGDRDYLAMRPTTATHPDRGGIDLDGRFALHARLGPLAPLWARGELAFAHAVSTPYRDKRSHFDGQDALENGSAEADGRMTSGRDGWLNRALAHLPGARAQTAIAVGRERMLLLDGRNPALSWSPEGELGLSAHGRDLLAMVSAPDPLFAAAAAEAAVLDETTGAPVRADAAGLAALSAEMLRGEARIAAFSLGGFDTHRNQAGAIRRPLTQLAEAVAALHDGLGPEIWGRTAVLAVTEFGRTARENGSGGTDHGTGGAMLFAGGALAGAKVHGDFPGLGPRALYQDRDLMPTDDLRRHAAWALRVLFGMDRGALETEVFPGVAMGGDPKVFA